jgi:hypothetical protein
MKEEKSPVGMVFEDGGYHFNLGNNMKDRRLRLSFYPLVGLVVGTLSTQKETPPKDI